MTTRTMAASVDAQQWFCKVLPSLAGAVWAASRSIPAAEERRGIKKHSFDEISSNLDKLYLSLEIQKENLRSPFQSLDESSVRGFFSELKTIISGPAVEQLIARRNPRNTVREFVTPQDGYPVASRVIM